MTQEKEFRTTDVDLAAFIHTVAEKCARVEYVDGKFKGEFCFPHSVALEVAVANWREDTAIGDVRAFAMNRTLLYRWARTVVDVSR